MSKDLFITTKDFTTPIARRFTDSYRKIEHISQEELIEALKIVITHSIGITPYDLCVITAKELGYKRTSSHILYYLNEAYKTMLKTKIAQEIEGKVSLI